MRNKFTVVLTLLATAFPLTTPGALAGNKFFDEGIQQFNKGHYSEAVGLFGAAKQTESDNPVLHYYLANALIKCNQRNDAIREYKIAMDLQPDGKLAQYCQTALRALGVLPAASAPSAPGAGAGLAHGKAAAPEASPGGKQDIKNIQKPKVVCIVDKSSNSYRVDMIMTDMQSAYGDVIDFTRSMADNPDASTKEILGKYNVSRIPAIVLIGNDGQPMMQFAGDLNEESVHKQIDLLAKTSMWKEPGVSQDPRLAEARHQILSELEARIASDQLRVDQEIKTLNNNAQDQISANRYSRMYSDTGEIQREADGKIQAIRADFEKRKAEWRAAAQAKIDGLKH